MSGEIKFDHQGLRTDFTLEIIELAVSGMQKVGTWKPSEGIALNRPAPPALVEQDMRTLVNKSFVVITAIVRIDIDVDMDVDIRSLPMTI